MKLPKARSTEYGAAFKAERVEAYMRVLDKAEKLLTTEKLPERDMRRQALEELFCKDGRRYATMPPRTATLGRLLHMLIAWHMSGGNLWGLYAAHSLAHSIADNLRRENRDSVWDEFGTMAIVILAIQGRDSRACEAWREVLGIPK